MEKPAALVKDDASSLAAALMAQEVLAEAAVVRNVCLYYPINFRILAKKRSKTAKFRPKNACHQRCHRFVTAPFLEQKALKTTNSKKCVFRVLRLLCCWASKFARFPPKNRLQVFAVLRNPFSSPKNLRMPSLSPPKSPVSNTSACRGTRRVSECLTRQPAED